MRARRQNLIDASPAAAGRAPGGAPRDASSPAGTAPQQAAAGAADAAGAVVPPNNPQRGRHAKAPASGFGREEGLKEPVYCCWIHACAIVRHLQAYEFTCPRYLRKSAAFELVPVIET